MKPFPQYIVLCAQPQAGKSLSQDLLKTMYGYQAVDTGGPLRKIAVDHLGLTWDQVLSQEGKASYVNILGKSWQVRDILGELGKHLEAMFGTDILAFMATNALPAGGRYSFVARRNQAHFYKQRGALVIGLTNPIVATSPYDFDQFDESAVDAWINNDAQQRGLDQHTGHFDLALKLGNVIQDWRSEIAA